MNWRLVLSLSGFGVLMGVISVLGFAQGIEGWLWLGIGIFCAVWMGRKLTQRRFWHGFLVGLIGGAVPSAIQALFFSTYLANNPEFTKAAAGLPPDIPLILIPLAGIPVGGLLSGAVLGLLTLLVGVLAGVRGGILLLAFGYLVLLAVGLLVSLLFYFPWRGVDAQDAQTTWERLEPMDKESRRDAVRDVLRDLRQAKQGEEWNAELWATRTEYEEWLAWFRGGRRSYSSRRGDGVIS